MSNTKRRYIYHEYSLICITADSDSNQLTNNLIPKQQKTPAPSLCYDCADTNNQECTAKTPNCPMCMTIRNTKNSSRSKHGRMNAFNNFVIVALVGRRCCWSDCGPAFTIRETNGIETYFCSGDLCNGPSADASFGLSGSMNI